MSEWTGTVIATSEFGIKVVDKGEWLNWSLPDYRGEPFDTDIAQGDRVRIEYAKGKGNKTYISVIENLSRPQETPAPSSAFPSEEDFPPDEGFPPGAPEPPSGPAAGLDVVVDREHSIVRQTCIKAAGMALQHNTGNAQEKAGQMTYLAGVLEDWCWR